MEAPLAADRKRPAGLFAVVGAVVIFLCAACSETDPSEPRSRSASAAKRDVPVVAFPAEREQLQETIQAVGTARALKSVELYPESPGIVTAVFFQPDQRVDADEILLQLDARDETLAVELAEVQLADAHRLVQRYDSINREGSNIAQSEIDTARAAVDTANIVLAQARVALDRRQIKAPFAGRVGITTIDVGDRVETTDLVTTLDDRSQLLVDFAVPEAFVSQVNPGTPVSVTLWEQAGLPFGGEVVATDSRIDPSTRAFIARAAIDNGTDNFRPGMAFEMGVDLSRGEFLAVPDVSVQWGADGAYIWTEQNATAVRLPVSVVKRLPGRLLIEADLEAGSMVVAEGVQGVRQGVSLRLIDPASLDQDARLELAQPGGAPASDVQGG